MNHIEIRQPFKSNPLRDAVYDILNDNLFAKIDEGQVYIDGQEEVYEAIESLIKARDEQRELEIRDSEYNGTLSILRGIGIKFNGKEVWKAREQWIQSAKAEAERKYELTQSSKGEAI